MMLKRNVEVSFFIIFPFCCVPSACKTFNHLAESDKPDVLSRIYEFYFKNRIMDKQRPSVNNDFVLAQFGKADSFENFGSFAIAGIPVLLEKNEIFNSKSEHCTTTCFHKKYSMWQYWIILFLNSQEKGRHLIENMPVSLRKHVIVLISSEVDLPAQKAIKIGARHLFLISKTQIVYLCTVCVMPTWNLIKRNKTYNLTTKITNFQKRCMNIQFWRTVSMLHTGKFMGEISSGQLDKEILNLNLTDPTYKGVGARSALIITQYLMKSLNVSVLNCYLEVSGNQYKYIAREPLSINFKLITVSIQLEHNPFSSLIQVGLARQVQFLSARTIDNKVVWASLIGPLGLPVFSASVFLVPLLIFIMHALSQFSKLTGIHHISFDEIGSAIIRPVFDQCLEDQLPSTKLYFRLILAVWLYYCLLVSETYRSELTSHLTKGHEKKWLKKFAEIVQKAEERKLLFIPADIEPNHISELLVVVKSEYEIHNDTDKKYSYIMKQIYDRLNTTVSELYVWTDKAKFKIWFKIIRSILDGTAGLFGLTSQLTALCEIFETTYGESLYRISDESITTMEMWAVLYGPLHLEILEKVRWLRDMGALAHVFEARADVFRRSAKYTFQHHVFDNLGMQKFNKLTIMNESGKGPTVLKVKHIVSVLALGTFGLSLAILIVCLESIVKRITVFIHRKRSITRINVATKQKYV